MITIILLCVVIIAFIAFLIAAIAGMLDVFGPYSNIPPNIMLASLFAIFFAFITAIIILPY